MSMLTSKVREICWGTYGKNPDYSNLMIQYVQIKDLSNNHIKAILDTQPHVRGRLRNVFVFELMVRAVAGIHIADVDGRYPDYPILIENNC